MKSIQQAVEEYGVPNLRFFIEMQELQWLGIFPGLAIKSSDTPYSMQECAIVEDRYKVADDYKITLAAINPVFGKEHYYLSDLNQLMHDHPDKFKLYAVDIDGYTQVHIKY